MKTREKGQGILEIVGCLGMVIGLCIAIMIILKALFGIDLGIQFPPGW